jgi:16S rRNA (guanine1207-N2)-methyltransferase
MVPPILDSVDVGEHYFAAEPTSGFVPRPVRARVWGLELELVGGSGVFSGTRLELGNSVMFRETAPPARAGSFLDLGCGYGVIACALAAAVPDCRVLAVDVNSRALDLTRLNAARTGLAARVDVSRPEEVDPAIIFDEIWSNPPVRIGKPALHDLLSTWLARLVPNGCAHLVVGRNLGADSLQRWLVEQGYPTRRIASAKGFRVLRAVRPADAGPS